jgi:hypothetical protein
MSRVQFAEAPPLATGRGSRSAGLEKTGFLLATSVVGPISRLSALGLVACLLAAAVALIGKPLMLVFPWWWTAIMHWATFWHWTPGALNYV